MKNPVGTMKIKKAGLALASPAGFSLILAVVNYAMILRIRRTQLLSWLMFLVLRGFIPFLHRVGFAHVLALLGLAVPFGPFLVIDMSLIVDPNLAVSAASSLDRLRFRSLVFLGRWRGGRQRMPPR